jgi:signal transduction histidine kinase
VEIRTEMVDGDLVVCVQDNGVGIHVQDFDSLTGNGLRNMRDRARNLGGDLEYLAVEPSGTMVRLVVPHNRL